MYSNRNYRHRYIELENKNLINIESTVKKSIVCIVIFLFVFAGANGYSQTNIAVKAYTNKIITTNSDFNTIKENFSSFWGKIIKPEGDTDVANPTEA